MTADRLASIEARLAAATPGPWEARSDGWTVRGPGFYRVATTNNYKLGDPAQDVANQEFIAESWQDIRDLLAEVRRLDPGTHGDAEFDRDTTPWREDELR